MKRLEALAFKTGDGKIVKPNWQGFVANVFVLLHDGDCLACRRVCQRFMEWQNEFAEWDAKIWCVWRGSFIPEGCQGVLEVGKARRKWIEGDSAGVLVVDRYGVLVEQWLPTSGSGFPSPGEVLSRVKQISLQCPE